MSALERMFFEVACDMFGGQDNVHFSFTSLLEGVPQSLPPDYKNIIEIDQRIIGSKQHLVISNYINNHNIKFAFCFDLQVRTKFGDLLRSSGVSKIISYWGAPISGESSFVKLYLKRLEVALSKNKPDLFIFESKAMQNFAVMGRGISPKNTCVIPTGVDIDKFRPDSSAKEYIYQQFNISIDDKIAFYSGHMEERKGVKVIVDAAIELLDNKKLSNWKFILCGNRPGEEQKYVNMLKGTVAENHVIFAGYRSDINKLIPGCDIGIVASTGWDSFPMSCLEMAACGLPLLVSALQGLHETIDEGKTGFTFKPGDSEELANLILYINGEEELRKKMSIAARERIVDFYSRPTQKENLFMAMKSVFY